MSAPSLHPGERATAGQTVNWAEWVYGEADVPLDDPAELYHEASKLSAVSVDPRAPGARLLAQSAQMRTTAARAVKRHPQSPRLRLPHPTVADAAFWSVVCRRQSNRRFKHDALPLSDLSSLLHAAYGVTHRVTDPPQPLRAVPSAGALYPLELYPVVCAVDGLAAGLHHFDPLDGVLEVIREGDPRRELERLTIYPDLFVSSAAVVFVTAMFWRTRFKYGLRGYRFALLEAGHVGQSLALTAAALGLAAVPVGGFYDRRVDAFLEVDGVNESAVYAFAVGPAADP